MGFDLAALNIVDFVAIIVLVISGGSGHIAGHDARNYGAGRLADLDCGGKAEHHPIWNPMLTDMIRVEGISQALAWGIPFIVVVVLWFAFSSLVSPGLSKAGLGGLDRWLGFLFRFDPRLCHRACNLCQRGGCS